MPFISIDWTTVFMLINTLILFFIVKKLLYKPVKKMIATRQEQAQKMLDDAQQSSQQAESLKQEYAQKLQLANQEAREIVQQASARANKRSEEIVQAAKQDAQQIMAKAEKSIALERSKAFNDLKNDISDIALSIASKVVEKDLTTGDQEKLVQDFIDHMGDA